MEVAKAEQQNPLDHVYDQSSDELGMVGKLVLCVELSVLGIWEWLRSQTWKKKKEVYCGHNDEWGWGFLVVVFALVCVLGVVALYRFLARSFRREKKLKAW